MTTKVETQPVNETDTDEMQVKVTTEDATGEMREYVISIGPTTMMDGKYIMSGRRVDDDAPDEMAGGGPSENAYDAAAKRFMEAGYDIYNRSYNND